MNLTKLRSLFAKHGCQKIYVKKLSPNDNSKNQIYLGGSFDILNILPISTIKSEAAGDWSRERFKAALNFSWLDDEGTSCPAPSTQLILYPKYPEVRLSGFLLGCKNAPSDLMTQRLADRLLFLSIASNGTILAYVCSPKEEVAKEFDHLKISEQHGVFKILELPVVRNNREKLLSELFRIHQLDWIVSKRLDRDGNVLPCPSRNCGGLTLEAELGIRPNGYSEPDYLGWEIKQFGVKKFQRINGSVITLMTPEPTDGFYVSAGIGDFIRTYGYPDISGRPDRINFGGIHKCGIRNNRTMLQLELVGFDAAVGKIRHVDGKISLMDSTGHEAASWSFANLLLHWNRKHNQACYVPSISDTADGRKYKYGNIALLGSGTDFQKFLSEMSIGNVYYDPGIKMEHASSKSPQVKRRSQFRIKSGNLGNLYESMETVELRER